MKIMSFEHDGSRSWGVVAADQVLDVGTSLPGIATVDDLLDHGGVSRLDEALLASRPAIPLDQVRFLPPVLNPRKIFCVGLNYYEHQEESHEEPTTDPTVFTRFSDSHVGHLEDVSKPGESDELDYEGELAVIIGRPGYQLQEEDAWDAIAGYSIYNDLSVRDWQVRTSQWTSGKNFLGVGSFGPWIVTTDELADIEDQTLTTTVDGEVVQRAKISDLIFGIPRLVAFISSFTPLSPGDVIVTGTPGGVGMAMDPPRFLQPGQSVSVAITGIGRLDNLIRDAVVTTGR